MAEVVLDKVWKIYGKTVEAVKCLDLDIKNGEFVAILGPSGCGKTSILRMIAGLEEITRGNLSIGGKVVNDVEPGDRNISMVFENYALLPHMTAYDNVAFPLSLRGVDKLEIDKKVREISKLLDMDYMLNELAASLGGGERQRVGIARALIRKSNVLLMDEPISHLDAALKAKTRTELVRLQKMLGITTVYVTHDQLEALAMADRIAVLNFGELQQFGTANDLYYAPENKFVADFVGEPPMNFIPCKLQRNPKGVRLFTENPGFDIALKGEDAGSIDPTFEDGSVWFGVRPKDITIVTSSEDDYSEKNLVKSQVLNFEPGCEHSIIEGKISEYRFLIQCDPVVTFKSDDTVYLDVTSKRFHLFDFQTENSILVKKL